MFSLKIFVLFFNGCLKSGGLFWFVFNFSLDLIKISLMCYESLFVVSYSLGMILDWYQSLYLALHDSICSESATSGVFFIVSSTATIVPS